MNRLNRTKVEHAYLRTCFLGEIVVGEPASSSSSSSPQLKSSSPLATVARNGIIMYINP
jgi:hypothetical protein